jgi:hypothetical protein
MLGMIVFPQIVRTRPDIATAVSFAGRAVELVLAWASRIRIRVEAPRLRHERGMRTGAALSTGVANASRIHVYRAAAAGLLAKQRKPRPSAVPHPRHRRPQRLFRNGSAEHFRSLYVSTADFVSASILALRGEHECHADIHPCPDHNLR